MRHDEVIHKLKQNNDIVDSIAVTDLCVYALCHKYKQEESLLYKWNVETYNMPAVLIKMENQFAVNPVLTQQNNSHIGFLYTTSIDLSNVKSDIQRLKGRTESVGNQESFSIKHKTEKIGTLLEFFEENLDTSENLLRDSVGGSSLNEFLEFPHSNTSSATKDFIETGKLNFKLNLTGKNFNELGRFSSRHNFRYESKEEGVLKDILFSKKRDERFVMFYASPLANRKKPSTFFLFSKEEKMQLLEKEKK